MIGKVCQDLIGVTPAHVFVRNLVKCIQGKSSTGQASTHSWRALQLAVPYRPVAVLHCQNPKGYRVLLDVGVDGRKLAALATQYAVVHCILLGWC